MSLLPQNHEDQAELMNEDQARIEHEAQEQAKHDQWLSPIAVAQLAKACLPHQHCQPVPTHNDTELRGRQEALVVHVEHHLWLDERTAKGGDEIQQQQCSKELHCPVQSCHHSSTTSTSILSFHI